MTKRLLFPDGRFMTRAQERMYWRVKSRPLTKPMYKPSRSSTKRTANILLTRGVFEGSIHTGVRIKKSFIQKYGTRGSI